MKETIEEHKAKIQRYINLKVPRIKLDIEQATKDIRELLSKTKSLDEWQKYYAEQRIFDVSLDNAYKKYSKEDADKFVGEMFKIFPGLVAENDPALKDMLALTKGKKMKEILKILDDLDKGV